MNVTTTLSDENGANEKQAGSKPTTDRERFERKRAAHYDEGKLLQVA